MLEKKILSLHSLHGLHGLQSAWSAFCGDRRTEIVLSLSDGLQSVWSAFWGGRHGITRDLKHHDGSHDDGIPEANFLLRSCAETE